MDNQITKKLCIIKAFWNIYLQDNYHFKYLDIKKNGLIFRIRIKNESRYDSWLKNSHKGSPNWTKTQTWTWHPKGQFDTLGVPIGTWHFLSANWPKFAAQPGDFQIEIKLFFFFLMLFRDKDAFEFISDLIQHPSLYK